MDYWRYLAVFEFSYVITEVREKSILKLAQYFS